MTVYLWHFAPVLVIAAAFYPAGMMPQPAIGSAQWWALRPAWLGLLTVVLVPMTMAIMRAERPMGRLPAGIGPAGPCSPAALLAAWPPPWQACPSSRWPASRRAAICPGPPWQAARPA
jgi:hypothetical protein